jgi:hypothetical protein
VGGTCAHCSVESIDLQLDQAETIGDLRSPTDRLAAGKTTATVAAQLGSACRHVRTRTALHNSSRLAALHCSSQMSHPVLAYAVCNHTGSTMVRLALVLVRSRIQACLGVQSVNVFSCEMCSDLPSVSLVLLFEPDTKQPYSASANQRMCEMF